MSVQVFSLPPVVYDTEVVLPLGRVRIYRIEMTDCDLLASSSTYLLLCSRDLT